MAEEGIKVRVEVDSATFNALNAELKRLTLAFKEAKTEAERQSLATEIHRVNTALSEQKSLLDAAKGGTGALMKAYFETGAALRVTSAASTDLTHVIKELRQEHRLQRFAVHEAAGAVATMGQIMGGAAGQGKVLAEGGTAILGTFTALSFAAKGLGAALGFATGGLTTIIAGVVAVGVGLKSVLGEISVESEKTRKHIVELTDTFEQLEFDLKRINREQFLNSIQANIGIQKKALKDLTEGVEKFDVMTAVFGRRGTMFKRIFGTPEEQLEAKIALDNAEKKYQETIEKFTKEDDEAAKKRKTIRDKEKHDIEEHVKHLEALDKMLADFKISVMIDGKEKQKAVIEQEFADNMNKFIRELREAPERENHITAAIVAARKDRIHKLNELDKIQGVPGSKPSALPGFTNKDLQKLMEENILLIQPLTQAFVNLGDTIQHEWIDRLIGSTSLFQRWVQDILSGLAEIILKFIEMKILTALFSLIPGVGPVAGVVAGAVTGAASSSQFGPPSTSMGGISPERLAGMTSFGRNRSEVVHVVQVEGHIAGRNIALVNRMAAVQERKRGVNF